MKVLIVEDEDIKRIALRDDLIDAGHETLAVELPKTALELIMKENFVINHTPILN